MIESTNLSVQRSRRKAVSYTLRPFTPSTIIISKRRSETFFKRSGLDKIILILLGTIICAFAIRQNHSLSERVFMASESGVTLFSSFASIHGGQEFSVQPQVQPLRTLSTLQLGENISRSTHRQVSQSSPVTTIENYKPSVTGSAADTNVQTRARAFASFTALRLRQMYAENVEIMMRPFINGIGNTWRWCTTIWNWPLPP